MIRKRSARPIALFAVWLGAATQVAASEPPPDAMAAIAGGTYVPLYGASDTPAHVGPYRLDVYPVTNAQYLAFVRDNPKWRREQVPGLFADDGYLSHWREALVPGEKAHPHAPVTNVSWFAAKAYCDAVDKRLPTLDEWEFAARADEAGPEARDRQAFNKRILTWYGKPTRLPLPDVGYTFENHWGVWDLHGLVWEWVSDFNSVVMTGASRKDAGGLDRQLFCAGGSIGSADPNDYAAFMRFAMRGSVKARYAVQNLGFRCAADSNGDTR